MPGSTDGGASGTEDRGFVFEPFRLEADGTLFRGETVVHLPPKELAALRLLVAHAGQIVTAEQLREALWGKVHVTADSVPRCLSSLRARLEPENCIHTIYKRGYRFLAPLREEATKAGEALPRVVVMPFSTGTNVQEHLGAAIAEETLAKLTEAEPAVVTVVARDSIFTLAGQGLTAHQVGQTLKADLVLTGKLRALPSHYRLRVEMIRVQDGSQIWVEELLIGRECAAGMEAELAERLCVRLRAGSAGMGYRKERAAAWWRAEGLELAAEAVEPVKREHMREAYELYQLAHHEWQTLRRHPMQDALQRLLRACELNPALIAAQVDLAQLCVAQEVHGFVAPAVAADCVRRAAQQLRGFSGQAESILPTLGFVQMHVDRDLASALVSFSRSAHLPHTAPITHARALFALSRHRFAEAVAILEGAIGDDPWAPWLHARLAWALHLAGQGVESVKQVRYCVKNFPGHESAALYGAMILPFNGEVENGLRLAVSLSPREPYFDFAMALHAYALACSGQAKEALERMERLRWLSRERFVPSSFNPAVYVALGEPEAAIEELRIAGQARCPWFFQMLADPRLKPLHGFPAFRAMRATLTQMEAAAAR